MKSIQNVIVLLDLLLMVLENLFGIFLFLTNFRDTNNAKNQESDFSKKATKSVFWHLTSSLEDDNHRTVDFNGDRITFTCQLIEIK